ncbi:aldose epimerase family protein [Acanthopleuribacter pedis]|uniref:Aldose 1-epimerase n=1 Tax=Acanthopleuribacter pedis TaxID=442870 RepID=A0A8J7QB61_9BACT|nr:aldose 1-epimerase [Acanthopleuribacter pedis]MBO1317651.1 aldose 1-epimerase [Acanthopleuribacter pedis]
MDHLKCGEVQIAIDPSQGARLASLRIAGMELLVPPTASTFHWGCYPMAPWTGRVRHGKFTFGGREYQLPITMPPHAIHGTTYNRPWRRVNGAPVFETDLGPDWPFAGRVVQTFNLAEDHLRLRMEIHSDQRPMPAAAGWHPWFNRQLSRGRPAKLHFQAQSMYARDEEQCITRDLITPTPGPWDDAFTDVKQPIEIEWPQALKLGFKANVNNWVVYDECAHAFCVEPQTEPPESLNTGTQIVEPGSPLCLEAELHWQVF